MEHAKNSATPSSGAPRPGLPAWAIGPAFCAVAAWMMLTSPPADVPRDEMHIVSRDSFLPGAPRQSMGEPPRVTMGGFEHACNECHRLFHSPPIERRILTQHTHIALDHGMNNRCFNCHDRANRERLVLHDGTLLGFDEVPRLCSQCHGTVYRDWQRGTHGKTLGSWDSASGKQQRLQCNDCHDPHAPAYKPIPPLPGPNTMRMGEQPAEGHQPHRHMPLRQRSLPEHLSPGESTRREEHP